MLDDENPEGERGRIGPLGEENIAETPPGIQQNKPLRQGPGDRIEEVSVSDCTGDGGRTSQSAAPKVMDHA